MLTKPIKKVALSHGGYLQIEKKYVFLKLNIGVLPYCWI